MEVQYSFSGNKTSFDLLQMYIFTPVVNGWLHTVHQFNNEKFISVIQLPFNNQVNRTECRQNICYNSFDSAIIGA